LAGPRYSARLGPELPVMAFPLFVGSLAFPDVVKAPAARIERGKAVRTSPFRMDQNETKILFTSQDGTGILF
jgi:hypothetical protein